MAGRGPAPKDPRNRARSREPAAGEWRTLPPLEGPVLGPLPARGRGTGGWSPRTRRLWNAWRQDWVTQMWGPTEHVLALELAELVEQSIVAGTAALQREIRLQTDLLGLTMRGKRDLRVRLGEPVAEVAPMSSRPSPQERYGQLRVLPGGMSDAGA